MSNDNIPSCASGWCLLLDMVQRYRRTVQTKANEGLVETDEDWLTLTTRSIKTTYLEPSSQNTIISSVGSIARSLTDNPIVPRCRTRPSCVADGSQITKRFEPLDVENVSAMSSYARHSPKSPLGITRNFFRSCCSQAYRRSRSFCSKSTCGRV